MLTFRTVAALLGAIVLQGAIWPVLDVSAADDIPGVDGGLSGILIDSQDGWIIFKADGEEKTAKIIIDPADFVQIEAMKSMFIASRVGVAYKNDGNSCRLVAIKRLPFRFNGTVTGEVVKNYGWWIELKPESGVPDAYTLNDGEKDKHLLATFKALKAGDSVTLTVATGAEQHRIQSIHKNAASGHDAAATKHGATSAAEHKAAKDGGKVAGILIDRQKDWITVKADGEEDAAKDVIDGADKKLQETMKMVFNACRVQLTYKSTGDARHLTGIKRQILKQTGTVTGDVVKVYNDFWVEVKPKSGLPDAYAPGANYNDKEFMAMLKGLKPGESVTITYNTDFERHRITSMHKNPGKPKTGG